MSDEESYAQQQALVRKIDDLCVKLDSTIKEYTIAITATGHNPPTPPRPKFELLVGVNDSVLYLKLLFKVIYEIPER